MRSHSSTSCLAVPTSEVAADLDVAMLDARSPRAAAAQLLQQLQARPLPIAPETVAELQVAMLAIVRTLQHLNAEIAQVEQRINALLATIEPAAPPADTATPTPTADGDRVAPAFPTAEPVDPRAGDMDRLRSVPGVEANVLPVTASAVGTTGPCGA